MQSINKTIYEFSDYSIGLEFLLLMLFPQIVFKPDVALVEFIRYICTSCYR